MRVLATLGLLTVLAPGIIALPGSTNAVVARNEASNVDYASSYLNKRQQDDDADSDTDDDGSDIKKRDEDPKYHHHDDDDDDDDDYEHEHEYEHKHDRKPHCPCHVRPCKPKCEPYKAPECLTERIARKLAETFEYFFINLDGQIATAVLTPAFQYISDSDNTLVFNGTSRVPGTVTYPSRAAFISGLPGDRFRAAPDPYVIEDLWYSCHKIVYRWVVPGGFGGPPSPKATVRGITILETANNGTFYQITKAFTEYNNLLAAADVNRCDVCTKITF